MESLSEVLEGNSNETLSEASEWSSNRSVDWKYRMKLWTEQLNEAFELIYWLKIRVKLLNKAVEWSSDWNIEWKSELNWVKHRMKLWDNEKEYEATKQEPNEAPSMNIRVRPSEATKWNPIFKLCFKKKSEGTKWSSN